MHTGIMAKRVKREGGLEAILPVLLRVIFSFATGPDVWALAQVNHSFRKELKESKGELQYVWDELNHVGWTFSIVQNGTEDHPYIVEPDTWVRDVEPSWQWSMDTQSFLKCWKLDGRSFVRKSESYTRFSVYIMNGGEGGLLESAGSMRVEDDESWKTRSWLMPLYFKVQGDNFKEGPWVGYITCGGQERLVGAMREGSSVFIKALRVSERCRNHLLLDFWNPKKGVRDFIENEEAELSTLMEGAEFTVPEISIKLYELKKI